MMTMMTRKWLRSAVALATFAGLLWAPLLPSGIVQAATPLEIVSFDFVNPPVIGTVDQSAKTIVLTVPSGTDVTALVPTFVTQGQDASVRVGQATQFSGSSAQDFTSPVVYLVQNAGTIPIPYTVTVQFAKKSSFTAGIDTANLVSAFSARIEEMKSNPPAESFQDADQHWAKRTIGSFVKLGFVNGYSDHTFRPDANITRGEFASIIARVFDIKQADGDSGKVLVDLPGHWSESSVSVLASHNIISGYADNTFKPDRLISRAEVIAVLSNVVDLETVEKVNSNVAFADIEGSWNQTDIRLAAEAGLVSGRGPSEFAPNQLCTRAEALTIVWRVLGLDEGIAELQLVVESMVDGGSEEE